MAVKKKEEKTQKKKVAPEIKNLVIKMIALRLPESIIEEIDRCVEDYQGMTQTDWILEAIVEKLEKST